MASPTLLLTLLAWHLLPLSEAKPGQCKTSCGHIPIRYPFGIDDGCGSPYYRHTLVCTDALELLLRTPSGRYPVKNISYDDPHILVRDPSQWSCQDGEHIHPARPFSLDASMPFRLSQQNDYLFFNCSDRAVIMEPRPMFCERFPEQCDSTCDTSSYLCRHLPECPRGVRSSVSCCSYYPKGSASLRMMLQHCTTYISVYWRNLGIAPAAYEQVPEYGARVDFDVPITARCQSCQDAGSGTCGFDTTTQEFLCLCGKGSNTTMNCNHNAHNSPAVVAGTVTAASMAGLLVGGGVWYLKKMRGKAPVTHGVQTNENRLF